MDDGGNKHSIQRNFHSSDVNVPRGSGEGEGRDTTIPLMNESY